MESSKIIELLSKLDSRTLTRFGEYLASPYFNKHKQVLLLGKYLLKEAPYFKNEKKIEKKRVFKNIFPNQVFDNTTFHRLSSQLLHLLHDFLIDDDWQQQKAKRGITLLKVLRQHKLEKHHKAIDKKYQKGVKKEQYNWSDFHENQYKYYQEKDALFVELGGRSYDSNLQMTNDALDQFFILEKLRIACEMANRNKIIKADYQWSMLEGIAQYLEVTEVIPVSIQIYYTILKMLTSNDTTAEVEYFKLKKLLEQHSLKLTKTEIADVYNHALNYAIAQINKKGAHYYAEALEHYSFLVENEAIYVDGFLMPWDYKNIVTAALRLEKYQWAAEFIEKYKSQLRPQDRANVYSYNLAALQYSQKDYKAALQALYNVEFINPTYYMGAKIIQLKSYYELEEGEALFSLIDAFKTYLRRSKDIADYRKKSNANLLNLTNKLYKLKERVNYRKGDPKNKIVYTKLKKEIEASDNVNNLDWIKDSFDRLKV